MDALNSSDFEDDSNAFHQPSRAAAGAPWANVLATLGLGVIGIEDHPPESKP